MKSKFTCIVLLIGILSISSYGQEVSVKGTVTDETSGEGLPGASVKIKGTTTGTVTDIDGNYSLSVNTGAILEFSYVGYLTQEITVDNQSEINISLVADLLSLDEIVVVGYTSQKKSDITGSISVVDMESLGKAAYTSMVQSLQGRVPGVTIQQDGQPGAGRSTMRIRGITTLNDNSPLYVVDGVPLDGEDGINNINPNDIESIQVLKDGAAASIYGSRAATGVVIVTTKKGRKGYTSVDAGVLVGVQTLANQIDVLNALEWGEVHWQAQINDGDPTPSHPILGNDPNGPIIPTGPQLIPNGNQEYIYTEQGTDWADEIYREALQQQYYVNITSGGDKGSVGLGFSYFDQEGLIDKTYHDRITARVNSSMDVTNWFRVGENFNISYTDQVLVGNQEAQDGIPLDVIRQNPLLPVFDTQGGYAGKISGLPDVRNMVSVLDKNQDNNETRWSVFGNAFIEMDVFDIISGINKNHSLKLRSSYGVEYYNNFKKIFNASFTEGDFDVQGNSLTNDWFERIGQVFTNTAEYNFDAGEHRLKVLGGFETVESQQKFLIGTNTGFEIESPEFTVLSAGTGTPVVFGSGESWGLRSFFGRADYVFNEKYFVGATIRYDESSRVAESDIFPAVSFGWNFTDESFMDGFLSGGGSFISSGKLRASWGQLGNQNIDNFAQFSTFGQNINSGNYDLSGSNTGTESGLVVTVQGNPNLRWETTTHTNFGLDLNFFDNSLALNFDYYIKKSEDILLPLPQLAAVGEGSFPFGNAATVENNGFEINLLYVHDKPSSEFTWSANFQLTQFKNEVTEIDPIAAQVGADGELYVPGDDIPTRHAVGQPMSSFYGWVTDGVFSSQAEVDAHVAQTGKDIGRIRYQNLNGDSLINDLDRQYIGDPWPDVTLGLNLSGSYKGFTLDVLFYSALGVDIYNRDVKQYTDFAFVSTFNRGRRVLDAWTPENPGSSIPAVTLTDDNNELRESTYFIEDGSFLKMRTIRLGYDIPAKFTGKFSVNVYAEVQNVFTITDYSGIDPEVPYAGSRNAPGIDRGVYPVPRIFMGGLNIKL